MGPGSLNGICEKAIGVALEAVGGLVCIRGWLRNFQKKDHIHLKEEIGFLDEKQVCFVAINGEDIVEKPNTMAIDDVEWLFRQELFG